MRQLFMLENCWANPKDDGAVAGAKRAMQEEQRRPTKSYWTLQPNAFPLEDPVMFCPVDRGQVHWTVSWLLNIFKPTTFIRGSKVDFLI